MKTLVISINEDELQKLETKANKLGLSVEELARQSIQQIINEPISVKKATEYVLKKNHELYQRLA